MSEQEYLDPKEMTLMFGVAGGVSALVGNLMIDIIREGYPPHWTLEEIWEDMFWEDWRDFMNEADRLLTTTPDQSLKSTPREMAPKEDE